MTVLRFPPVRAVATHGRPTQPRDGTAPGATPELPARGGVSCQEALRLVNRPGDVADRVLARACRVVQLEYGPHEREHGRAKVLLDSIPAADGGEKR